MREALSCAERTVYRYVNFGRIAGIAGVLILFGGCTRESLRVAIETQQRADLVQQAVFDRQHEGLRIFLYRDLVRRLEQAGVELSEAQRSVINDVWNERDLIEFWHMQHERSRALRMIGVDAMLYSDQSIVDLLWKSLSAKLDRVKQGLAGVAGAKVRK